MGKINVICLKCGTLFKVDEVHIGKKGRCTKCGERFIISRPQQNQEATPDSAKKQIEVTQPVRPESKASEQVPQPVQQKAESAQQIQATIKQSEPSSIDETIPSPKDKQSGDDIAATIAAPAQKDAAEIQREEQDVPVEWEEGQTILDLYEVKKVHTGGGMGLVYRVHHKNWNMDLAVKSPRAEYFKTQEHKDSFIGECERWIELGLHPNIVSCYYVRTLGGIPRVFAEYVEGGSLKDWIENRKLYEGGKEKALERILDIAVQFAWGLQYAHEQGLIHQDVKPANVMMTNEGEAKVTDFGLAKARASVGEVGIGDVQQNILVSSGGMTPAYCSPEQANKQPLSRKTDIWSWGLSVLEMFAGEVFWRAGQAALEALESYLESVPEDESIPKMPETLVEVLKQCFQRNPDDRPKDMAEIVGKLKNTYKEINGEGYSRPEPKPAELLADGLNNKAVSMLDLGKKEEAEKLYNEALKADPHHPEATYNRGLLLWRSGRMTDDKLVKQLEEVRTTHSDDWHSAYLLGLVHIERSDAESAVKVLKEAAEQAPEENAIWSALQTAHEDNGKRARCVRTFEGHTNVVNFVVLSADGHMALSGSLDKTLRLWDVHKGECVRVLEGLTDYISDLRFSADLKWALSYSIHDESVRFWNVTQGKCISVLKKKVFGYCLSSNGQLALLGLHQEASVWDPLTWKQLQCFGGYETQVLNLVCFSGDTRLVLAGNFVDLRLWEIATGKCVSILKDYIGGNCICLSLDGRWVFTGLNDNTICLWDTSIGKCVRTFEGHDDSVNAVHQSADSRWMLSSSSDGTKRLWDVATKRCIRTFEVRGSIYMSANGKLALSAVENNLKLWAILGDNPRTVAPSILCKIGSYSVRAHEQSYFHMYLEQSKCAMSKGMLSEAHKALQRARSISGYERHPEAIEVWFDLGLKSRRVGIRGFYQKRTFEGHIDAVNSVCLSADSRWVLSGDDGGHLFLWEMLTGKCIRKFELHPSFPAHFKPIYSVCLSADACWALSGSDDKSVRLWEVVTGKCVREYRGHNHSVHSVCFTPDGNFILSGSMDATIRLWELATGKCIHIFEGHKNWVSSVCVTPDGRHVVSGSLDKTVRLWDIVTGNLVRAFEGNTSEINSICVTPDGQYVLSAGEDAMLRLWDLRTGECLRTFKHDHIISSVCVTSDSRWAFSGSWDRMLKMWDIRTGKCVYTIKGHAGTVVSCSVCVSPDGRWVLSGSSDKTLRLWETDWDYEVPEPADWDEGAKPYLEIFLTLHCPYGPDGISHIDKPVWNEEDFKKLLKDLQYRGYGWLRPDGVHKKLEELATNWEGQMLDVLPNSTDEQEKAERTFAKAILTNKSAQTELVEVDQVSASQSQANGRGTKVDNIRLSSKPYVIMATFTIHPIFKKLPSELYDRGIRRVIAYTRKEVEERFGNELSKFKAHYTIERTTVLIEWELANDAHLKEFADLLNQRWNANMSEAAEGAKPFVV